MEPIKTLCSVDGCGSRVLATGLCTKHYNRLRRKGTTDDTRKNARQPCSVEGCERWRVTHTLCGLHRDRMLRAPERKAVRAAGREGRVCAVCGDPITDRNAKAIFCSVKCKSVDRRNSGKASASQLVCYYKRQYGLTVDEIAEKLAAQDGRCAICGTTEAGGRHNVFAVDHDHGTGAVRGMLCNNCNIGIGYLGDSPETLDAAAAYLRRYLLPVP